MAEFEVKVVQIDDVQEHPNADRLTLVSIGGYTCIANKHDDGSWRYKPGDFVIYIPEQAVLPEWLLQWMGFWNEERGVGGLAGPRGNRVKAIKLRGIFSEGVLLPIKHIDHDGHPLGFFEYPTSLGTTEIAQPGDDVADKLGVVKYEPPIPSSMSGQVFNLGFAPVKFDLEPVEKHMELFTDTSTIALTEKLHGTFTGFSLICGLNHPEAFDTPFNSRDIVIYSKGLGAKGLVFKDVPENDANIYVQTWRKLAALDQFWTWLDKVLEIDMDRLHILGETYGPGVQDLHYGASKREFRVFAVGYTKDRETFWAPPMAVEDHARNMGTQPVPMLYRGPFNIEIIEQFRDGDTTLGAEHIREGVVITALDGRKDPEFGPMRLKAVSPAYKLRKGGTELT